MRSRIPEGMKCRNLRHWKTKGIVLLIAFTFATGAFSLYAEGQSQGTRKVENSGDSSKQELNSSSRPAASPAPPQQSQSKQPPQKTDKSQDKNPDLDAESIRINSNLVAVPVSVTDTNGQPVRNLTAEDFQLEEEGELQQLQTLGEPGKTPVELALLFDVSRSVRNRFDFEREAAIRFLREVLKSGDAVSVFEIGRDPRITMERTQNVESVISKTKLIDPTDESTAFFDTVVRAARYLDDHAEPSARRVVIAISDGEDTNSERFRLSDALRDLQRGDSLFYSINPSGPSIRLNRISTRGHEGMVRLATETGGLAFLPDRLEELNRVFAQIAAELQAQYLLGYYSTNEKNDGQYRRISVKVPKRQELRIRARKGYYAPKD
jgi:Ca-activated chloride channel homolog